MSIRSIDLLFGGMTKSDSWYAMNVWRSARKRGFYMKGTTNKEF